MRTTLSILAAGLALLSACNNPDTKGNARASMDTSFTIQGHITGVDSGYVYFLDYESDGHGADSAKVENGAFAFKGKAEYPHYYYFGIRKDGQLEFRNGLFAENTTVRITGHKDSTDKLSITGGPVQTEYAAFLLGKKKLQAEEEQASKLYEQFQASNDKKGLDSVMKLFQAFEAKEKEMVKSYAKANPSSPVSAFELYQTFIMNPEYKELDSCFNFLSEDMRKSFFGKKLAETLATAKNTAIGNPAPDFSQADPSGKMITLSSLRPQYVLIDFWASWCGPCRAENPFVVAAYNKYHKKGFEILGVSFDEDKDKWLKAIEKDHLTWKHVSDLKGWKNSLASVYGIHGIPMNFLLDKEGKIIAKGLRGEDLEKKLEEVMK